MKRTLWHVFSFVVLLSICGSGFAKDSKHYILYVGTYTNGASKGIYAYRYDASTGDVQSLGLAAEARNPSFLAADARGEHLFAVNELNRYQGESSGGVSSFTIDRKTGKLSQLNEVASHGAYPCYLSLDRSGKYLLVANYAGGNVAVIPVLPDGHLGEASSVLKDEGTLGPNKERQEAPHAHWIAASARNRFAYVADLGLDRVLIYRFDAEKGVLSRGESAPPAGNPGSSRGRDFFSATLAPGTGPRHIAFSADGRFMYVLGELDATVTVFANDDRETYRSIQKISARPTGPAGLGGKNTAAEIAIHPKREMLYTSNRGDETIATFSIDGATGRLSSAGRVSAFGKTPRHFAIDPSGTHLLIANQDTGNIVEYAVDEPTGNLSKPHEVAKVASPVCLLFVAEE